MRAVLVAEGFHELSINRRSRVLPFAANIGHDGGEVFVVELRHRRHTQVPHPVANLHRATESMHDDARHDVGLAEHPLAVDERRRQAIEAVTMRLVAPRTQAVVNRPAALKGSRLDWS